MNIKNIILKLLPAVLVLLTSCMNETDDIFNQKPDERRDEVFENCRSTLTNASNGWVMRYFITPESGGINMLASFDNQGLVKVAANNMYTSNSFREAESRYAMMQEGGPMLTFITYNNVLHAFSDPDLHSGVSLGGDFEFMIFDVTDEQIALQGKRSHANFIMTKMPDNIKWQDYLQELSDMVQTLFSPGSPDLTLKVEDKSYTFSDGETSAFSVIENGVDTAKVQKLPFVITEKGLYLYAPEELSGAGAQTFELNEEKSALVSVENPDVRLSGPNNQAPYFSNNQTSIWEIDIDNASPSITALYNRIAKFCADNYQSEKTTLAIAYTTARRMFSLRLIMLRNGGRQSIQGNLDMVLSHDGANTVTFAATGEGDANAMTFVSRINGYEELSKLISKSFRISTKSVINPLDMRFTQSDGTEVWFQTVRQ